MPGQVAGYVIPRDSRNSGAKPIFATCIVNTGNRLQAFVLPFLRLERKVKITSPITGEPYDAAAERDTSWSPQRLSTRMLCGGIIHLP